MANAIVIALAALLIAAAIALVFRWEIAVDSSGVYRLDRWSGDVTGCRPILLSRNLDCSR
jgi:hypothetical protein